MAGEGTTNETMLIDLPAALQLAGARNLDIEIARERLAEAKAAYESALWQFFPSVSPGITYRRHDNFVQNVEGRILDVHKDSYSVGPAITAQVDLGEAIYRRLASRQLVTAAVFGLENQRQESVLGAALGYFDLAKAHAAIAVAEEAIRISQEYVDQLQQAVGAGVAFRGDALRAQVQVERNRITLRQALEQQRIAAARLVQLLRLQSGTQLAVREGELLPVAVVPTNAALHTLVSHALAERPELAQSRASLEAARDARRGAVYGPLVPSVGAQLFLGGLGGGSRSAPDRFGETEDYQFSVGWRIGPGGLLDRPRVRALDARSKIASLTEQKLGDEITRQVTETFNRAQSFADQIGIARRGMEAAAETLRLTRDRRQFGVGAVLEVIQAEQELTRARLEYFNAIAEHNKAQYSLSRAIGALAGGASTPSGDASSSPPGQ